MIRVTILDYGIGNLHSLAKAATMRGTDVRIATDIAAALRTDRLILPGVGAFGPAASVLAPYRDMTRDALRAGLPCLGICLGMQLLFDTSEEGVGAGLGLLPGRIRRLKARQLPQIGWNAIEVPADPAFERSPLAMAYYANSFVAEPAAAGCVVGWSRHEADRFPAAVRSGETLGVQFHPEKSGEAGLAFIRSWILNGSTS